MTTNVDPSTDDVIAELRARVTWLETRLAALAGEREAPPDPTPPDPTDESASAPGPTSRRNVLRLAGAAAVGGISAATIGSRIAAADGGVNLNVSPTTTASPTRSNYTGTAANASGFVFQSGTTYSSNVDSISNAALAGWASTGGNNRDGVYGYTDKANGYGVFGLGFGGSGVGGVGNVGGDFSGTRAALKLATVNNLAPQTVNAPGTIGMIQADETGSVWICVATGTPGLWRKLGGGSAAGAFHALTPGRVYDSRVALPAPGAISSGGSRTVSVAHRRSVDNGSVAQADFVPAGATAITCNVTVVGTVDRGYLAVNPGGVLAVNAAAVNWFGSGQILNNGVSLTLNGNREVTVIAGGGGSTDFVLDVTGYFL